MKKGDEEISDIFKKTLSGFLIVLGLVIVLMTGNKITGNVIGSNQPLNLMHLAVAIWGILIVIAGILVGFAKK